ncbi:hypothetical protein FCV25MIE_21436 [Fagus crenata]
MKVKSSPLSSSSSFRCVNIGLEMKGSEMDSNHVMLNEKLIENNHDIQNPKLNAFDILKEALVIIFKKFNFIIFIFLASIPLFCFKVYYEIFLQSNLVETSNILKQTPGYSDFGWPIPDFINNKMTKHVFYELLQLGFLYLVPLHLLELCTVVVTVDLSSKIYAEERPMTLKEMILKPIYGARLGGTFITSICVLHLSTCTLLGLIWLVTYYVILENSMIKVFLAVFYGVAFVALLTKYLEWSAMWNMSIVISVLEGIYGYEAFALSAYFSKGSERRGLILMIVFFVWGLGLRLPCLYFGCYEGWLGISVQISLFCLGNVLKWVVCMVYFYDCKKRILEKKVDEEVGRDVKDVDEEVEIGSMQSQCWTRSYSSSVDLV